MLKFTAAVTLCSMGLLLSSDAARAGCCNRRSTCCNAAPTCCAPAPTCCAPAASGGATAPAAPAAPVDTSAPPAPAPSASTMNGDSSLAYRSYSYDSNGAAMATPMASPAPRATRLPPNMFSADRKVQGIRMW